MNFEQPALERELDAARKFDDVEAAFVKVSRLIETFSTPENFGRRLFVRGLDKIIPDVATRMQFEAQPHQKSNENVCIVATEFYMTGGHTRVALDFARDLGPEARPVVIVTNTHTTPARYRAMLKQPKMQSPFGERAFLQLTASTLVEKTIELYMMLKAMRATRIVLICHPYDITALVATWPFRDIVEFVHHVDHCPALGASLPYSAHVDVTFTCHGACKAGGIDAVYSGMTSAVTEPQLHRREPGRLRLATCGDQRKYEGAGQRRWTDYAVAAMRQPGAEMLHIGEMKEGFQREVHQALIAEGLDATRYVFAGPMPSLPQALIDQGTDVYLSSYPVSGGKANLEAIFAGVPAVVPIDDGTPPLLRWSLPLSHYTVIERPDQLGNAVTRALEIGEMMRRPEEALSRETEISRFAAYVAGHALPPA